MQIGRLYPSDLSDQQWKLIQNLIPIARTGGRPRTTDMRQVLNAIFYLNRSGCAWRYLPKNFPPWRTVYEYFSAWQRGGVWEELNNFLIKKVRIFEGKHPSPQVLIIDSQSKSAHFGESRGYDGYKKVRGRKRHIVVDSLGLVQSVRVGSAIEIDAQPAIKMLDPKSPSFPKTLTRPLRAIYADGAYKGKFDAKMFARFGIWVTLKISQHVKNAEKEGRNLTHSNLTPTRWIVERTFAWFNHYRRLARDYERTNNHSATHVIIAMQQIMLRRLFQIQKQKRWGS